MGKKGGGVLDRVVPGYQEARIVLAACRMGIFGSVGRGSHGAADLAARLGLDPAAAEVLLNALVSLGLLAKRNGLFRATSLTRRCLLEGGADYRGDLLLHQGRMEALWRSLEEKVKGGPLPSPPGEGQAALREFVMAMEANALRIGPRAAGAVDLAGVDRLLDLGGGPGTYSRLFIARRPGMSATLFDMPEVIAVARRLPANRALEGRLRYRGGDFLIDSLGRGWDLIWASNVIHSLSPRDALLLLARCRRALSRGGRLLLHDFYLDASGTRPRRAAIFSVHMLAVTPSGRSWRLEDALGAMADAGFAAPRVTAAFESTAILEGRRA